MSSEIRNGELPTDIHAWLRMVEDLRHAPDWNAVELPIEIVQTHISMVLLGRRRVLKLKKPVDFGFLDYTTLAKRLMACEAEVTLNRRLCPDIYLGVQPIAEVNGHARLSGGGGIVDYGVWMKRLPSDYMLDRMVAQDAVTEAIIDRVADRLCAFHQTARRDREVDAYGASEVIRRNWEENFLQTAPYINHSITTSEFDSVRSWTLRWLENNEELLSARVRDGRICDGHGDVRSESICVTNGICIYDCIEFNDRFRCGDTASEAAFLAMDLDARGRPDLSYYFTERHQTYAADAQLFTVLPFYRCYRAFVRGKVLSFRLLEPEFSEAEREAALLRAKNYFDLARRYATPLKTRTVVAIAGLSGTGKTSVARAIAGELGWRVVSSDAVRKSLFGDEEQAIGYSEGRYREEANRRTYQTLVDTGCKLLEENGGVVLDATFQRAADRLMARAMAEAGGARWRFIECRLSAELVRQRLALRAARKDGLSDATWATYKRQEFEIVDTASSRTHLALDTNDTLLECSHKATDWLRANDDQS